MKVLVTGLSGFTGAYVKEQLEQSGHAVVGLQSNLLDWKAVADEVLTTQPQAVIHLAAISYVPSGDNSDVYGINTLGTQGLLEALDALPSTPQKIVLASSSIVYGMKEGRISEDSCPQPVNHYGCSKLSMEHIAATYGDRLPIVIARPFNYTGIGQDEKFLVPKIVSHFTNKKRVIELGNIDVERDFSDVRWIAQAYLALLNAGQPGECYNLCSGRAITIKSILRTLEEITGHTMDVTVNPEFVRKNDIKTQSGDPIKVVALMNDLSTPDFSETLEWMVSSTHSNITSKHN